MEDVSAWVYDDPLIDSRDWLLRRIPMTPNFCTFDLLDGRPRLHPAALRREAGEGMSVHLQSILVSRKRDITTLYDEGFGSVRFLVGVPRTAGAGVLCTPAEGDLDTDRAASHAEVRPPTWEKNRTAWKSVSNTIALHAEWIVLPDWESR